MTCVYIKPGIKKKNGTTAMTTNKATNKACIGWLDENSDLKGKEWQIS